jgi:hypothetical protein
VNTEWDLSFFRGITQYCEAAGDRVNQRETAVGADLSAAQFHVEVPGLLPELRRNWSLAKLLVGVLLSSTPRPYCGEWSA